MSGNAAWCSGLSCRARSSQISRRVSSSEAVPARCPPMAAARGAGIDGANPETALPSDAARRAALQARGRARYPGARYVVLCLTEEEAREARQLSRRERQAEADFLEYVATSRHEPARTSWSSDTRTLISTPSPSPHSSPSKTAMDRSIWP